ncbi:lipid II flippase MurJ [Listeria booriae]|uniref:murein biosynthesis integral membrane protein MurJ n=1 Tax=Listeria booriae TaxID=1552123 RepID=UPI0028804B9D|nr:lipid II flippase MurJ [Listeria booriae]MDT0111517.1 lipid II flippase MurJ [Listeria booriae]
MTSKLIKPFMLMLLLTLSTQFFGLIKNVFIAKIFGVGAEVDAYNLANTYTISITNLAIPAIIVVLIPFLTKRGDSVAERAAINTYVSVLLLVIALAVGIGIGSLSWVLKNQHGLSESLTITLSIIMILSTAQVYRVLTAVLTAFRQVENDFLTAKIATLCGTILSSIYIIVAQSPSILLVSLFLTISFMLEATILLVRNRGFGFRIQFKWGNRIFRKLIQQTGPVVFNSIVSQVSLLLSITLASFIGQGYVATLGYANQILSIIQALILVNILTITYPSMSRIFAKTTAVGKELFIKYAIVTNMLVIPLVIGIAVIGDLFTALLFERGAFTAADTKQVTLFMTVLGIGLPGLVLRDFIYRIYFCLDDTKTPSRISVITIIVNVLLLLILTPIFNIYAVLFIPGFMNFVSAWFAYRLLEKRIGRIDARHKLVKQQLLVIFNASVMGVVLYYLKAYIHLSPILGFLLLVVTGIVVYGAMVLLTQRRFIQALKMKGANNDEESVDNELGSPLE